MPLEEWIALLNALAEQRGLPATPPAEHWLRYFKRNMTPAEALDADASTT